MIDRTLANVAAEFWTDAGGPEPFPRALEAAVLWTLPLGLVKVPRLGVAHVRDWMTSRRVPIRLCTPDRPLHGCLIAHNGAGWVMLDGADTEDERRFTYAHEVAHFLMDYHLPRRRALAEHGPSILDVFDGRRAPTLEERIHGMLADAPPGPIAHLMERRSDGALGCVRVAGAENRADQLALELLAPADLVRASLAPLARVADTEDVTIRAVTLLNTTFGLPLSVARPYGVALAGSLAGTRSFRSWLGL